MRKITQNLRWLVTLLAMIVSMGAWATVYKLTITASDFNTTSYAANNNEKTSTAVCTTDATKKFEVKWTSNQVMKNGDNMQWQKSGGYLYNSTNLGTIKSVTVTSSGGTFTTYYGTSEHPTSGTTVGNGFFTVKVGNATGTSSKVEVVFEKGDPAATPTFSVAGGEYTEAQSVEISCATEGATIFYTIDGRTPTESSTEYSGAIEISKTTTVKAIAVKEGYDNSEIATAIYTIMPPISGYTIDFEHPLSDYELWTFTNISKQSDITAHGGTFYGANVNSNGSGVASATIQTKDPVVNPLTFTCYVSKTSTNTTASTWYVEVLSNGNTWTSVESQDATSMTKGEWIEVTADLSDYSNVYVRLRYDGTQAVRAVDDISITLGGTPKVATPTFSVAGGEYTEAQSVEISCTTEGATIYYTTDGNEPTTSSTEYSGAIDISSTTTLKAIAVKSEMRNSDVAEVKYTINIPQPVSEAQYALVTSNDQLEAGKEYIIVGKYSTSDTYFAMSTTQNENNRGIVGITVSGDIATISSSDVQVITLEGSSKGWYFKAGNGYLYAASSGSNWLRTEEEADDNAKAIIDIASNGNATIEFQGANKRNLLRFNSNNSIFSCYGSGQLPVQLYKKVEATPEVINVTLSASGISSYCHANALDFSQATCEDADADALKAYAVIAVNSTSATLEEINNPKGNTGLILIGTGGATYSVPVSSSGDTPTDNYLVGTTTSTVVVAEEGYSYYALSGGEFVKLNINGSAIQANKAYLRVPNSSSGAKTLNLSIDGVDAIESVEVEDNTEFVIYNLAGQRMNTLHKGINIMNGKKVIVK